MSTLSMLKFRASISTAVLALASLSPASRAQDAGRAVKVNVPFAFDTGNHHFAPGVYTISLDSTQHVLLIRGVSDSGLAIILVEDNGQQAQRGSAVFHKYGEQYFLNEISVGGSSRHIHLWKSEAESREQIAQSKTAPQSVNLALLR